MSHSVPQTAREFARQCGDTHNKMKYIAAGIIGRAADAEDIVQQAYAIAIEKNELFDSREQYLAWLAGVVKNCSLNYRRKHARRKTSPTGPDSLKHVKDRQFPGDLKMDGKGEMSPDQTSFDDHVVNALKTISSEARACLLLRTIEQLSYKEIAGYMQIPEGTAMSLVHRSRKTLRALLSSHYSGLHHDPEAEHE